MTKLSDRAAIAICLCAILFILIGGLVHTAPLTINAAVLPAVDSAKPGITGAGFAPNAVPPGIAVNVRGVELYGSWVGGDASTGEVRTRWYRPASAFYLSLCGFPKNMPGSIFIEVQTPEGLQKLQPNLDENPEFWRLQKVSLSGFHDVTAFRIVASDSSKVSMGWLGFSQPFTIPSQHTVDVLKQLILVLLCVAACLVAFIGPGLLIRARSSRASSPVWLAFTGIICMSLLGLFAWKGPSTISPALSCRGVLLIFSLVLTYTLLRRPLSSFTTYTERRVLAILMVLIALAVAKATYSIGPSGELYRNRISRTLEVGARSDSRIPFHVVQAIGLRKGAYSEMEKALLAPWSFSHRGPLAAIAVSPIVLTSGARIEATPPDDAWTVFDPQGFAVYRIAMIVLGGASLIVVFSLARLFLDDEWAVFAFFAAATAPFTVHELFFTWPKIVAASFVLLGIYLIKRNKFVAAGSAIGLGYLCHPSALLWFPAVLLTIPLLNVMPRLNRKAKLLSWSKFALTTCIGWAFWMLLWHHVNRGHFEQTGFLGYFRQVGSLPPTLGNWLRFRGVTAMKTLVPFDIFWFHRTDPDLIAADGSTQAWVQFIQQYWCSLAFAGGTLFYFVLLRLVAPTIRKAKPWLLVVFFPSLLLFIAYFGAPNMGLMREGLHAWFLGFIVFSVIVWRKYLPGSKPLWSFATAALTFRALEVLWVLVPFASWTRGYLLQPPFLISDFCSLLVMVAGSLWLLVYAVARCRSLRPSETAPQATYTTEALRC